MVPRIQNPDVCHSTGYDGCEESSLVEKSTPRTPIKTRLTNEELDLGIWLERKRLFSRVFMLGCTTLGLGTAAAIAAYAIAWSSWSTSDDWRNYERGLQIEPDSIYKPAKDHILYVGVLSQPEHFDQRMLARRVWMDKLRKQTNNLEGKIKVEFLVGQVSLTGTPDANGAVIANKAEKKFEERLQHEASWHGDIRRIPVTKSTTHTTHQVLWLLWNALEWKARFVMKVSDDEQVDVEKVLAMLQERSPIAPPVHFGQVWKNNSLGEADGRNSWFFEGCFGVSGDLAHKISVMHIDHSIGFPLYGTTNADVNMARWVKHEDDLQRDHGLASVKHMWMPGSCKHIAEDEALEA